jgi:hypothetical protein
MLENKLTKALSASILRLLRPLVRILLRNGVAYGSFTELARKVYVDVAFEEFAPSGKKQTVSRVSAMTGLTRKEVKRLLEMEGPVDPRSQQRFNRGIRVISGWLHDSRFHDSSGKPADLPIDGKRNSFADLVRDYSGDIPTKAMLTMLEEAGNVRQVKGKVRLVRHAYVPGNDPVNMLQILGTDVGELIATIDHNLTADADDLLFQRKVAYDNIDPAAVTKLKKMSFNKAQSLLEQLDRQYSRHEVDSDSDDGGKYISLGIYFHERNSEEE